MTALSYLPFRLRLHSLCASVACIPSCAASYFPGIASIFCSVAAITARPPCGAKP